MKFIRAKKLSYGLVRPYKDVVAIVLHYTGNVGDSAENNARFFAHENQRQAGAHVFVDQKGNKVKSVKYSRPAWSVGIFFTRAGGGARYWGELNNFNTISIEMCDCATKDPSPEMIKALKEVIKDIRKHCKNAKKIVRHWDICGKQCPARMTGIDNERWEKLLIALGEKEPTKKKSSDNHKGNKKSVDEVAKEVIAGKWGNGASRKRKLKKAGYNYKEVQKRVNEILRG